MNDECKVYCSECNGYLWSISTADSGGTDLMQIKCPCQKTLAESVREGIKRSRGAGVKFSIREMKMSKIKVPEGMLEASLIQDTDSDRAVATIILESALRWLSENPIAPTHQQVQAIANSNVYYTEDVSKWIAEWIRRMFLDSEPEIPEEIHNLLWSERESSEPSETSVSIHARKMHNAEVIEAYRRGQKAGSK